MQSATSKWKVLIVFGLLLSLLLIGTFGYIFLEDFSLLDAVYMTVITVATVGYGDLPALHTAGKIFTIFLIILSLGVLAYAISFITSHLMEGQIEIFLSGRIRNNKITMKDHVIICGYGRNGRQAAIDLKMYKKPFVIIEKNHELVQNCDDKDIVFVEGDATEDEVLIRAGVQKAQALITTLPVDADNLYVVLTARSISPACRIISRATHDSADKKLKTAGADNVIMPDKVGGSHMATLIAKPDLLEFLSQLSVQGDQGVNLIEIKCSDLPIEMQEKTIHDLSIRRISGANIIGYKSHEGKFIINPGPHTKLMKDSKLIVLGTPEQIEKMKSIIKLQT
ncbi:MAG: potassium channel protein [Bacteroidota bacterium]